MNASRSPIEVKLSSSVVSTWTATIDTATRDTVRWMPSTTKRGHRSDCQRPQSITPSTTLAVSRTRAMVPAPRVAYHQTLGEAASGSVIAAPASRRRG